MATITINESLLKALPSGHAKNYRSILEQCGILGPDDEISFDPTAKLYKSGNLRSWGPNDPHHIACVDGCYEMFELAYNACMAQGGSQMACGKIGEQTFDACVTTMCGEDIE